MLARALVCCHGGFSRFQYHFTLASAVVCLFRSPTRPVHDTLVTEHREPDSLALLISIAVSADNLFLVLHKCKISLEMARFEYHLFV